MATTIDRIYNYFEYNKLLHVLFVFDPMDTISIELMGLAWKPGFRYVEFDGKSWFNMKYHLETDWKDDKVVLVFHLPYPETMDQMLEFPLMDLLVANATYREESYAEFMEQYGLPQSMEVFVSNHIGELQPKKFTDVLKAYYNPTDFTVDNICRGFISVYLKQKNVLNWDRIIARIIILGKAEKKKDRDAFFRQLMSNKDAEEALQSRLESITGQRYLPNTEEKVKNVAEAIKYNNICQNLPQNPNDRYRCYKIRDGLTLSRFNQTMENLRNDGQLAGVFQQAIDELGKGILEEELIRTYGVNAPFNQITDSLCWPILRQIIHDLMPQQSHIALTRLQPMVDEHKLTLDATSEESITTLCCIANYFVKANATGSLVLSSPDEYVSKYAQEYYLIDTYYRLSLEHFYNLDPAVCLIYDDIQELKLKMDLHYSQKCNDLNTEWIKCIQEYGNTFSEIHLPKQQNFYQDHLELSRTKQVVIVSDAMRYEVAMELMQELSKEKHPHTISAALAMLPTETKYCKTALLPHAKLTLNGGEMLLDGNSVSSTDLRTSQISQFKTGGVCIDSKVLMAKSQAERRDVMKAPLIYVLHDRIDKEGHDQSGKELTKACRETVTELAALVHHIHMTLNITEIFITADHGFLYEDKTFAEKDKHPLQEEGIEKKTRYYLTASKDVMPGIAKFDLEKVSGIEGSGLKIAVPIGTNRVMAAGGYNFAHGGASLQELIIPVVHSTLKRTDDRNTVTVSLANGQQELAIQSSLLKFRLLQNEAVSADLKPLDIIYAVYANGNPITRVEKVTLDSTSEVPQDRTKEFTLTVQHVPAGVSILELRVYADSDHLNPLISRNVRNATLIEMDF